MLCFGCGAENSSRARRCRSCGRDLRGGGPPPGSLIASRYKVLEQLGAGGMGIVYRTRDLKLDEDVALKVLPIGASADRVRRFRSEIKLAWKVRHRNVCGIHEYGEDGELLYISMELVAGRDLKRIVREQGPFAWEEACDIALQVAEGLKAIHDAGVIHRDLKSANIMLDDRGVVRLLDFGIAKAWSEPANAGITDTGQVVGSPEYMSPEQVRGGRLDARSDIYACGVVLFELLTGHVPFGGETKSEIMHKQLEQRPPLEGREASQIPVALMGPLHKALAKNPDQRYASCAQLIAALREARGALDRHPTDSLTATTPRQRSGADRLLVPVLLRALRHQDEEVRVGAVRALRRMRGGAPGAAAGLTEALGDRSAAVRSEAARALAEVEPEAAALSAAVAPLREDPDERVRAAALETLARSAAPAPVGGPSPRTTPSVEAPADSAAGPRSRRTSRGSSGEHGARARPGGRGSARRDSRGR